MSSAPCRGEAHKHSSNTVIVMTAPSGFRSPKIDLSVSIITAPLWLKNSWGLNITYAWTMYKHNFKCSNDCSKNIKIFKFSNIWKLLINSLKTIH